MSQPAPALGPRLANRANILNLVRLVLASAVIIGHAWPIIGSTDRPSLLFIGGIAVNGFFAASGYLIAGSRMGVSLIGYAWRRALRILPALVVCTLLTAFVLAPVAAGREGGTYSGASAWRFSWNQILLRNKVWDIDGTLTQVPEAGNWNGSTWTLQHEVLAYVSVGLLLSIPIIRRHGKIVVPALFVGSVLTWFLAVKVGHVHTNFYLQNLRLGSYFLAGAAAYFVRERIPVRATYLTGAAAVYILLNVLDLDQQWGQVPLTYLVLGLGSITWENWTTNNDISYGVYIYAFPVGQMLVVFGSASLGLIPNIAMTTAGTAILAWLSWHIIERPALRLKRLVVSGRTPQHRLREQPGVGS